jgi:cytochrome c oxidase subunit III
LNPSTLAIALLIAVVVWGVIVRKLTVKPWVQQPAGEHLEGIEPFTQPAAKVAFYFLLAVITSLFLLFFTAYNMRMSPHHGGDWHPVTEPNLLWLNTGLLILSSVTMQWARRLAVLGNQDKLFLALIGGGLLTLAFLGGQLVAWDQMQASGQYSLINPASAFFYLLTAVHGFHLIGGLVVWARTLIKIKTGASVESLNLTVELCSLYWHYLLVVWLALFALLVST